MISILLKKYLEVKSLYSKRNIDFAFYRFSARQLYVVTYLAQHVYAETFATVHACVSLYSLLFTKSLIFYPTIIRFFTVSTTNAILNLECF